MKLPEIPPQSVPEDIPVVIPRLADTPVEQNGNYLHWDELRRREAPTGLTHRQWWVGVHFNRSAIQKKIPLLSTTGHAFSFAMTESIQSLIHQIDRDATGSLHPPDVITNKSTQQRYLVRSLIEEALTSSQIEGAVATAKEAKQIIQAGRKPRNTSEKMVLNNYHAMQFIRSHRDEKLNLEFILELHRIITSDTLEEGEAGRVRGESDQIKVVDQQDGTVLHFPPPAKELSSRLAAMCEFANHGGAGFTHPLVRAILVHFWMGYDHPFCDGNGRTARALFYWSMLNQGYWLTEYISISRVLKKAPTKYVDSYLHSETPPFDATHFVRYQLEVIQRSIAELHEYLDRKQKEVRQVDTLLVNNRDLNHRQVSLLSEVLRSPELVFTMKRHRETHRIANETARKDIYKLRDMGLLLERRRGNRLEYTAMTNLPDVLGRLP